MNKHINDKLDLIDHTLAVLPDDEQAEMLALLAQRVSDRTASLMTPEQRAIVRQRMSEPRDYATAADVEVVLAKFRHRP